MADLVGVGCSEPDAVRLRVDAPDLVGLCVDAPDMVELRDGALDLVGLPVACGDLVGLTGTHAPQTDVVYPAMQRPEKKGVQELYPTGQE